MMATQNLSLSQAIRRREQLLNQVNDDLIKLNKDFLENPSKINIETTFSLIRNLRLINATIEKKRSENLSKEKCCGCLSGRVVKTTTKVVIGIHFLAWLAVGGFSIYSLATAKDSGERGRDAAEVVITIVALFLTTVVAGAIKGYDDDLDRAHLLNEISVIKQQGEEHFEQFLIAFDAFQKSQRGEPVVQKQKLSECVHHLDRMPESGYRAKIPSRDHWVSLLVEMLPENHPIKMKLNELKAAAMHIFELEEQNDELVYRGSPAIPRMASSGEDKKLKHKLRVDVDSFDSDEEASDKKTDARIKRTDSSHSGSESSSSDSSPRPPRKFSGERLALPDWFRKARPSAPLLIKEKGSADEEIVSDDLGILPSLKRQYQELYKSEWSRLEEDMGFTVNCIHLNGHCFDRHCNVSDRLERLPTFRPSLDRGAREERLIDSDDSMV